MSDPITLYTLLLTIFTLVLAAFTAWMALSTKGLLTQAKSQLHEMRQSLLIAKQSADAAEATASVARDTLVATQRAWITIDELGVGDSSLVFGPNGVSASVSFKLTNVGNSPAHNLRLHARMHVQKPDGPQALQEQKRLCDEVRKERLAEGFALFPQDSFPSSQGFGRISIGVGASADDVAQGRQLSADGKVVMVFVVGCVDYSFPTDPQRHHQTGFIREIRMSDGALLNAADGSIQADQLRLLPLALGVGQTAD